MTELMESCSDGDCLLAVDEGCTNFGFSGRGEDVAHDLGHRVDGAIEGWVGSRQLVGSAGAVTKKVVAPSAASCPGLRQIGGIAVDMEYHVTSGVPNDGVWVRGGIVEQPEGVGIRLFCAG